MQNKKKKKQRKPSNDKIHSNNKHIFNKITDTETKHKHKRNVRHIHNNRNGGIGNKNSKSCDSVFCHMAFDTWGSHGLREHRSWYIFSSSSKLDTWLYSSGISWLLFTSNIVQSCTMRANLRTLHQKQTFDGSLC